MNKEITLLVVLCVSVFLLAILVYQNIENTQPEENTKLFEGQNNTPITIELVVGFVMFWITIGILFITGIKINKSRNRE